MDTVKKLTEREIEDALKNLSGWTLDEGKLFREFKFKSFKKAFAFMTAVAEIAEADRHHPEWFNVYSTVRVHLTTHEAGGLSTRDISMADKMNALASDAG